MSIATERGDQQTYAKVGDDWIPVLHLLNLGEGDTVEIATMGNKAKLMKIGDDWIPVATLMDANGNAVNTDSLDPLTTVDLSDDFIGGVNTAGNIGELGWNGAGGTFASSTVAANHPGVHRRDTSASSGTTAYLVLRASTGVGVILADMLFDMTWVFRLNTNDADTRVRIGLSSDPSIDAPVSAIYIEKTLVDTQWFGVCRSASAESRTAALATIDTGWHKIRIRRISASTIGFTFDAGTEATLATNVPGAVAVQPSTHIFNNAAASKTIDYDFFQLRITGMVR